MPLEVVHVALLGGDRDALAVLGPGGREPLERRLGAVDALGRRGRAAGRRAGPQGAVREVRGAHEARPAFARFAVDRGDALVVAREPRVDVGAEGGELVEAAGRVVVERKMRRVRERPLLVRALRTQIVDLDFVEAVPEFEELEDLRAPTRSSTVSADVCSFGRPVPSSSKYVAQLRPTGEHN